MIYLFEDRQDRMAQYLKTKLDATYIKQALIDCSKENLLDYLKENYSDAITIIFHSSYIFSSKDITVQDIKGYFLKKKVPFIYFSGGLGNNLVLENGFINGNVNSGDMYKNLDYFIKHFSENQSVNIPILIYGKKYLLNSLLEFQYLINNYLFEKSNDYILSKIDFEKIIDFLDVRLKEKEFQKDKFMLIEWLKNQNVSSKYLTKDVLLNQIQKMIEEY